jgi:Acyltransferase family
MSEREIVRPCWSATSIDDGHPERDGADCRSRHDPVRGGAPCGDEPRNADPAEDLSRRRIATRILVGCHRAHACRRPGSRRHLLCPLRIMHSPQSRRRRAQSPPISRPTDDSDRHSGPRDHRRRGACGARRTRSRTRDLVVRILRDFLLSDLSFAADCASAVVAGLPAETRMWEYGWGAAAICYPLWIMGAMLAEHTPRIAPRRTEYLWLRRAVMVFAGACCAAVRHFEWATYLPMISYAVTGALGVPFLRAEIAHARAVRPPALGEGLGQASYSLYLSHIVPLTFAERALSAVSQWVAGPLELATVSVSTLVFYILCERPALLLARSISITPGQWNSLSAMRRKRTLAPAAWSKTPEPPAC